MLWRFTPFAVPLFVGTLMLGVVAAMAWRRRATPGTIYLFATCVALIFYVLGYAVQLGATTPASVLLWMKVQYIGIVTVSVTLFFLVLAYTGRQRVFTPFQHITLLIIPAITLTLAWTNELHGWLWRDVTYRDLYGTLAMFFERGTWYWVYVAYNWLLFIGAVALLVRAFARTSGVYRQQIGTILAGTSIPLIVNILYLARLVPAGIDWNVYAFLPTVLLAAWGMFNIQLFDIAPIARDAVVENLGDAVIILDTLERIADLNPAALAILGITRAQAIGQPARQVLSTWYEILDQPPDATTAAPLSLEEDGQPREFDLHVSPLLARSGRQVGRLLVLHDTTELHRLIGELDAYAHTVAHDLKAPLSIVIGHAALTMEMTATLNNPDLLRSIEAMNRSSVRMYAIINELLLLASVRRQEDVPITPLNMAQIVADTQDRLAEQIDACGGRIVTPEAWPVALGHAPWVQEVWANYISNALKYGGSPPAVELGAEPAPGEMLRFWVRDNGAGLALEEQSNLFDEFSHTLMTRAQGSGLGLSIVQRIVRRLGGEVAVESTNGYGSTFSFTLPAAGEHPTPQP